MAWANRCNDILETLQNLAGVVGQQATAMQQMGTNLQQVAQDKSNASGAMSYKKFMDMDPPAFVGKTDPEAAESWVREIERIFRVLEVPAERQVDFGTYRLKEHAEKWWETTHAVKFQNGPVTWPQFVEMFNNTYFPKHERTKKMQKFLDLQQGERTLAEYITRFHSLERYCPNVYTTDEDRAMKFSRGLKAGLRNCMYTRGPKTLDEAIQVKTTIM
jgi:hypothetical protein